MTTLEVKRFCPLRVTNNLGNGQTFPTCLRTGLGDGKRTPNDIPMIERCPLQASSCSNLTPEQYNKVVPYAKRLGRLS